MVASVVVTALFQLTQLSCRKSATDQQREAQRATEEAEQKASETTITSGELPASDRASDDREAREARDRALREQAEAVVAARNEQLEYREKLQRELDDLDAKRRDAKKRGAAHLKVVDARREVLKQDLDALDRATDTEWPALKAKIDRDLRDHSAERESR